MFIYVASQHHLRNYCCEKGVRKLAGEAKMWNFLWLKGKVILGVKKFGSFRPRRHFLELVLGVVGTGRCWYVVVGSGR